MELLQRLKESIAWLGGALAALTAICYATGYYAFHAHLTMLGLGRVVDFKHEDMLLEGARFFFAVTAHLLQMMLALGAGGVSVLVSVLVMLALLGEIGPLARSGRRAREWLTKYECTVRHLGNSLGTNLHLMSLAYLFRMTVFLPQKDRS